MRLGFLKMHNRRCTQVEQRNSRRSVFQPFSRATAAISLLVTRNAILEMYSHELITPPRNSSGWPSLPSNRRHPRHMTEYILDTPWWAGRPRLWHTLTANLIH